MRILLLLILSLSACSAVAQGGEQGWVKMQSPTGSPRGLAVVGKDTVYIGTTSQAFKSIDGGNSWRQLDPENLRPYTNIQFDGEAGWAMSRDVPGNTTAMVRTSNGGETWEESFCGILAQNFIMLNKDTIAVIGRDNRQATTFNGGKDWFWMYVNEDPGVNYLQDVAAFDQKRLFAVGDEHTGDGFHLRASLAYSQDAGKTWTALIGKHRDSIGGGLNGSFNAVAVLDSLTAIAVGPPSEVAPYSIHFFKAHIERHPFYHQDMPWIFTSVELPTAVKRTIWTDVAFYDSKTGYAVGTESPVGSGAKIIRTTDGGETWTQQVSGSLDAPSRISIIDSLTAIIVCWKGDVLKTENGGFSWVKQGDQQQYPAVLLFDPVRARYSIRFELVRPANVILQILDSKGALVREPLRGSVLDPRLHEIELPTEGLTSGAYAWILRVDAEFASGLFNIAQ